jgi:hypothetical protein
MARREKICAKLKPTSSGPGVKFWSTIGEPFVWPGRGYL